MAIAAPLAKTYGMNKAIEMAYEQLGIEPPADESINIFTGGGISQAFAPQNLMNTFKRGAVNLGIRSLGKIGNIGGGAFLPAALMGGALMLGRAFDPTRPGSRNYNPYLESQLTTLSGKDGFIGRDGGSGLMKYGPNSVLSGQNVMSLFGTNDYIGQLEKKKDYFEQRIDKNKNYNKKMYEKTLEELKDARQDEMMKELAEEERSRNKTTMNLMTKKDAYTGGGGNGGNQGANAGGAKLGSGMTTGQHAAFRMSRGGIATL